MVFTAPISIKSAPVSLPMLFAVDSEAKDCCSFLSVRISALSEDEATKSTLPLFKRAISNFLESMEVSMCSSLWFLNVPRITTGWRFLP